MSAAGKEPADEAGEAMIAGKEPVDEDKPVKSYWESRYGDPVTVVEIQKPRPSPQKPVTGLDEKVYKPQNKTTFQIAPRNDLERKSAFELYLYYWFQEFNVFMKKQWQPLKPDRLYMTQQKRKYKVQHKMEPKSATAQVVGALAAVEVAEVAGMGRGLIAKQDLNVGDVIQFNNDVLLMLPPKWDMVKMNKETGKIEMSNKTVPIQRELDAKSSKTEQMMTEAFNGALTTLVNKNFETARGKAKFNTLVGADAYEKIRRNNYYDVTLCWQDETDPQSKKICSIDITILFEMISMMNHDDDPNTEIVYPDINPQDDSPMLNLNFQRIVYFKVLKPIKKGEQVTQDYKPDMVGAAKRQELKSVWGIGAKQPETEAAGEATASGSAKRKTAYDGVMERHSKYYHPFVSPDEAGAPPASYFEQRYGAPTPNASRARSTRYSLDVPPVPENYQVEIQSNEQSAVEGLLGLQQPPA